jgi:hypothetical protein
VSEYYALSEYNSTFKNTNYSGLLRVYILWSPTVGGYKYRDLALQVGGVSDETVKYSHEF